MSSAHKILWHWNIGIANQQAGAPHKRFSELTYIHSGGALTETRSYLIHMRQNHASSLNRRETSILFIKEQGCLICIFDDTAMDGCQSS